MKISTDKVKEFGWVMAVIAVGVVLSLFLETCTPKVGFEETKAFAENARLISIAYASELDAPEPPPPKPVEERLLLGWFTLSRYYTPEEGQAAYLNGWKPGKENQCDIHNLTWRQGSGSFSAEACINGSGDLFTTADGTDLHNVTPYTSVACEKSLLGAKLLIEGFGEVVCHDTGGAVGAGELDVWIGAGDTGYTNYINGDSLPKGANVYRLL